MPERRNPMDDYPVGTWVAHKPETWPWRYATLREPVKFRYWHGRAADPEWTEITRAAGTPVKIVMVSRFGDVGITDNLSAETGYAARVFLDVLEQSGAPKPGAGHG